MLGNLEMIFPNTKQSQGVECRRFPASGLPSASPRGSLASTPLVPLVLTPSEGNQALPRPNYPKRPSGIWPKA